MRPRTPTDRRGVLVGTGLIIGCLTATLVALIYPVWSYTDRSGTGADPLTAQSVDTPYGPLSALDREFVTAVRLAGLWELPAGEQAEHKGTTQAVRAAGRRLVEGHTVLDERVRDVASRLSLSLPNTPTSGQKRWLREFDTAQGPDYDSRFVNVLRLAQGEEFPLVAQVRAGTRNSLVRGLADVADAGVLDQIQVLESTGYVDYEALAEDLDSAGSSARPSPAPPAPATDPAPAIPVMPSGTPPDTPPAATSAPAPSASAASSATASAPSPTPSFPLPPPASSPPPSGT
ncbi:DUF4142 domain-containing protein [Streptomyces sp. MS06]|uniref:DUF4142 domain-containing protein n=1 Tax=Streptomyces sp. MS06 TaxID=3385974 RepID=UPI0039A267C5